jgi:hypothetical protein
MMKNKIYYLGLASVLLITAVGVFILMHWPGAGIGLVIGMLILCFAFIPSAFISSYYSGENKPLKFLYIITALVFIINFTSALFKLMHWPGANLLLMISLPLPFILILPVYLMQNREENKISYKNFLAILFFFAYFAAISGLQSLGISKSTTDGYVKSAIRIEQETDIIKSQCDYLHDKLMAGNKVNKTNLATISQTMDYSDKLCLDIDNLVNKLIRLKDNLILENGKPDLWRIKFKDAPVEYEIQDSLLVLKSDIYKYKKFFGKFNFEANDLKDLDGLIGTNDDNDGFIKNKITVSSIEKLYLLKHQVRIAEWEGLSKLE